MIKRFFSQLSVLVMVTLPLSSFNKPDSEKGLKDYYRTCFPVGVAVNPRDFRGKEAELILKNFNSLTPENAMKMGPIHPDQNRYFWTNADSIVAFATHNKLKVRGHCLVWHAQTPRWLFRDSVGNDINKEELFRRMKEHITTVVSRYKGKIYAWDVVNEVIADAPSAYFRKSKWTDIANEEFVAKAFEYAHAADPKAVLFYNDYNTEQPAKRDKIYKMLKKLIDDGVPVNGVGLQGHWSVNNPSREELEKSITMFGSLGLQVQITELDVSVYAGNQGGQLINGQGTTQKAVYTPEMEAAQSEKYKMIFDVFRKYKKTITGVTFWNVSDKYTWLDGRGRKNFPLLFDTELKPKKAFYEVTSF